LRARERDAEKAYLTELLAIGEDNIVVFEVVVGVDHDEEQPVRIVLLAEPVRHRVARYEEEGHIVGERSAGARDWEPRSFLLDRRIGDDRRPLADALESGIGPQPTASDDARQVLDQCHVDREHGSERTSAYGGASLQSSRTGVRLDWLRSIAPPDYYRDPEVRRCQGPGPNPISGGLHGPCSHP
jgi:hypothetical protein